MSTKVTRASALELLKSYTEGDYLLRHAYAVEAVMRYFARLNGEDEEKWGIIGLLHDLDFEKYPERHCQETARILKSHDYPEAYIRAIMSHGYGICTDVKPEQLMEKALFAMDELTGLIYAACLMRPSKSVLDIEVKSVKKKFKDKAFAAGVDRRIILDGCEMLDMQLEEVIAVTIAGMREAADAIGLRGTM